MTDNKNWSAYFLWKDGALISDHVMRCPKTARAIEQAPLCKIRGRAPSVFFSLLRPGTRIPPHTGYVNTRLICHLPLIVPGKCLFRVGNDARSWVKDEARNDSAEMRVVLIFDIWRPELTEGERNLVATTLEAIDSYGIA
jgi:aspartyl/asparaginyl beta-hydroxylase (cupin superfamily)